MIIIYLLKEFKKIKNLILEEHSKMLKKIKDLIEKNNPPVFFRLIKSLILSNHQLLFKPMKILNQTIIGLLVNKMYRILTSSGLDLTQQA